MTRSWHRIYGAGMKVGHLLITVTVCSSYLKLTCEEEREICKTKKGNAYRGVRIWKTIEMKTHIEKQNRLMWCIRVTDSV